MGSTLPVTGDDGFAAAGIAAAPQPRPSPTVTPSLPPSPTPSPALPPPPPASRGALRGELQALIAAAERQLSDGTVAVAVVDEHQRDVVAHQADVALLPASTNKLLPAAAALMTFGGDHRFTTEVRAAAPVEDGTVDGDLVLVGTGDPALATEEYGRFAYPIRPRTPLEDLADDVVDAGVQHVAGDVVGMAPGFTGERLADGWLDRYLWSYDARYITGLTVDAGLEVVLERAPSPPPSPSASTDDAAAAPAPVGSVQLLLAKDPALQAAAQLRRLLDERGVTVAGDAGSARVGSLPDDLDTTLGEVDSPPLAQLLRHTLRESDNHMADTLVRTVGAARTGDGSWDGAADGVEEVLTGLGLDHRRLVLDDGSGLSRDNRVTARLLAGIDATMAASRHARAWADAMAVTGEEGTLERRLADTIGDGRFLGKTGTLDDVTSLAGSAEGRDGRRYHLAVIANDAESADRGVARALMDRLVLALVADLDGCDAEVVSLPSPSPTTTSPDTPLGIPDMAYVCDQPAA